VKSSLARRVAPKLTEIWFTALRTCVSLKSYSACRCVRGSPRGALASSVAGTQSDKGLHHSCYHPRAELFYCLTFKYFADVAKEGGFVVQELGEEEAIV